MAGMQVSRPLLDQKAAQAVLEVRRALHHVEVVFDWLANNPSNASGGDLLTKPEEQGGFGYTEDEAYLIRYVIEGIHNNNIQLFIDAGKKLTGLE